jgi:hypothetical protein
MHTTIGGMFDTEIYEIDDGYLVIEQAPGTAVLFAPDELKLVIEDLQARYDSRARWQEPIRG